MGITNSNKGFSTASIDCNGSFQVRLSLTAAPDIVSSPTDIVLILDRSGSMAGSALTNLKLGAKAFIDIISEATGGARSGQIGSGSRIGIVSFSSTAVKDTQLITSVSDLGAAVDALSANGNTNHADAFAKASELLALPSTNAKVMVMFTDGQTTVGPDPSPIAAAARDAGTVIYTIGLSGRDGVDAAALEDWASSLPLPMWPSRRTPPNWRRFLPNWPETSPTQAPQTSKSPTPYPPALRSLMCPHQG